MDKTDIAIPLPYGSANPDHTFERFVTDAGNASASDACRQFLEQPPERRAPLVLYGGTGAGKTHLLHAMAHRLAASGCRRIVLAASERLVDEMLAAIRRGHGGTDVFFRLFRNAGAILIDDAHAMHGKPRASDDLFRGLDMLRRLGASIALAFSDEADDAVGFAALVRGRLCDSDRQMVRVFPPGVAARLEIARRMAAEHGVSLGPDDARALVSRHFGDVRALMGAVAERIARERFGTRPPQEG